MVATGNQKPTPEQLRERFESKLRSDIESAVRAGVMPVADAVAETNRQVADVAEKVSQLETARQRMDLPGSDSETYRGEKFSLGKVIRSLVTGNREDAPMEWAMSDEAWQGRDMATAPDSAGGFVVPGEVMAEQLIPLLRPRIVALELGATELSGLTTTPVEIPRETTGPTVDAVSENNANTAADMAFGQIRMEPHTAQSYIKASRRFLMMGVQAEPFIRRRMAQEIAITVNQWCLKGSGAAGQPVGVLNASGLSTGPLWNGTIAGADDVAPTFYLACVETEEALMSADAYEGADSLGWAIPPRFLRAARQVRSTDQGGGTADNVIKMSRSVIDSAKPQTIIGYPYRLTTQLDQTTANAGETIFGDWSKMVLASWGGVVLEASNVADDALSKRQTHIVAYWDVDVALTQPSAFIVGTDHDFSVI